MRVHHRHPASPSAHIYIYIYIKRLGHTYAYANVHVECIIHSDSHLYTAFVSLTTSSLSLMLGLRLRSQLVHDGLGAACMSTVVPV